MSEEVIEHEKQILEWNYSQLLKSHLLMKKDFEDLLKALIDKHVIKSWHYNGGFDYEFSEDNSTDYNKICELERQLKAEKSINEYFKARFVKCSTCTSEDKEKCLMFSEHFCEGERCTEYIDLEGLLDKATENGGLK